MMKMDVSPIQGGPWLLATYQPVSLFSLKSALATSSGGKTVLVPTPYAVKMALLSAAIRLRGVAYGRNLFPVLRDLRIGLRVPERLVVINGFGKVRRPWEPPKQKGSDRDAAEARARLKGTFPWNSTIAYREYVQFGSALEFAFASASDDAAGSDLAAVTPLLCCINYLGRRGGFVQLAGIPEPADELPSGYHTLTQEGAGAFGLDWTLHTLDDCGPSLTFDQANIYTRERIALGRGRVLRHIPLPLRLAQSSRSFSLYQRID